MKHILVSLFIGISASTLTAQTEPPSQKKDRYFSFENGDGLTLSEASGLTTSISSKESVLGDKSLKVSWTEKGGSLTFRLPIEARNKIINQAKHTSVFHQWIYSSENSENEIRIDFGKKDSIHPLCGFSYHLNFTGWRITLFPFNRMQGNAAEEMDWLRFTIPAGSKPGSIYLDYLIPSSQLDRRQASFDQSYKFDKEDLESRIRLTGHRDIYKQGLKKIYAPAISASDRAKLDLLEKRLQDGLLSGANPTSLDKLKKTYTGTYKLTEGSKGRHIFNNKLTTFYSRSLPEKKAKQLISISLQNAGSFLKQIITTWHLTTSESEKAELESMFLGFTQHLFKVGWHKGHGQGNLANFGYTSREYYQANFLARDMLKKHKLRETMAQTLQWFNYAHYSFDPKAVFDYSNADHYNTMAYSQLLGLMLSESPEERFFTVLQFSRTLDNSIQLLRHGNSGGFKEDGSLYHHWGHYPAYQSGAMTHIAKIFRLLYSTPFQLSKKSHRIFQKSLLAERFTSNLTSTPRTLSGRHAYPENDLGGQKSAFVDFALAGSEAQDGSSPINAKVAAATLRLFPDAASQFPGIKPESSPQGHIAQPYANISAHRRADWLALARGHSKYIFGSEIYGTVNHYARYQSHGVLELLPLAGLKGSGITQEGWDWSRPSGATVTHLPIEKLPFKSIIKMYSSNQTFAGNIHMDHQQGMFALQLHEPNLEKDPNIGVQAKKSYSFFDDLIICLGSDISGPSKTYPTETVLFQQHLATPETPQQLYQNNVFTPIKSFPWKQNFNTALTLTDLNHTLYYLPNNTKVKLARSTQNSYYHYKKLGEGIPTIAPTPPDQNAPTKGDYSVAVIDHGIAPTNASYEYAVVPFASEKRTAEFLQQTKTAKPYQILQQDKHSHIVRYQNYTSYALFTGKTNTSEKILIHSSSRPCLAMTKKSAEHITLNISDPDLRFPNNEGGTLAGEIFVTDSLAPEQLPLTITLNGNYTLSNNPDIALSNKDGKTTFTFDTKRGRTYSFKLKKK